MEEWKDERLQEPSVLDYVKAKLAPWRGPAPQIPFPRPSEGISPDSYRIPTEADSHPGQVVPATRPVAWPWLSTAALSLALFAQLSLEPRVGRSWEMGAVLYALAVVSLVWANHRGEWSLARPPEEERCVDPLTIRYTMLWIGMGSGLAAFWAFGGNRFTGFNLTLWVLAVFFVARAFWLEEGRPIHLLPRLAAFARKPRWQATISRWTLLALAAAGLVIFFRVYQLEQVPPQMVSDHAEKLLDVWDVLQGETRIFFPRNTGREAMQMYMTAAAVRYLGMDLSFTSLKFGAVLAGLLTLPFIYLLGKEIANSRVGFLAMLFAGMAYWPNVVARSGLRFPLYPLFVAPTLYFLIRGIRRSSRNDFILAGLFLGIGLHGYTPIRILPFVVVAGVVLYLLHRHSLGFRKQTLWALVVLAFVSLMALLPLARYSFSDPDMFGYRAFSRLGTLERPLPAPAWEVFAGNFWNAITMYAWDDGSIWPVSVTHRPALDVVSGALFHVGAALLFVRYLRRRHWLDLFLLLSIPLLMMPSILSLAYPDENPALNRASGALAPVFLIVAIALEGLLVGVKTHLGRPHGARIAWGLAIFLIAWSAAHNYDLVFRQYRQSYELSAGNTDEMGRVIRSFAEAGGSLDGAWVVAIPHWVDTRLVGMHAGNPTRDYAVFPERLEDTRAYPDAKLFLINREDVASIETLRRLYPEGWLRPYISQYENKDFWIYTTPPDEVYR